MNEQTIVVDDWSPGTELDGKLVDAVHAAVDENRVTLIEDAANPGRPVAAVVPASLYRRATLGAAAPQQPPYGGAR